MTLFILERKKKIIALGWFGKEFYNKRTIFN